MTPDAVPRGILESIDRTVAGVLREAGVPAPPVDAIGIARRRGIWIVKDAGQKPRGRFSRVGRRATIFVRPDDRPERTQWTVAHELGESLAHQVFDGAGLSVEEAGEVAREQVANLVASRLLIPSAWFPEDARRLQEDLFELKALYQTASHELLAWRLLDLPAPSVVTVFDHGRVTRRRGNFSSRAPLISGAERQCRKETHDFGRAADVRSGGLIVRGWPIHEPGWRREILRATWSGEEGAASFDE